MPYHKIRVDVTNLNLRFTLITMLNRDAFKNCSSLVTLDIPDNNINVIHASAFNGLIRLEDISGHIKELHLANNENIKTCQELIYQSLLYYIYTKLDYLICHILYQMLQNEKNFMFIKTVSQIFLNITSNFMIGKD